MVHLYYGQGVGKTTRAIGLAVRAAGEGLLVNFVQFLKSGTSAEVGILENIENIRYWCPGKHPFITSRGAHPVHYQHARDAYQFALCEAKSGQVLICDEILDTLLFDLLKKQDLLHLIECCRGHVELVMTGRNAPSDLIETADYATEMVQVKHPYYNGAKARKGIEY